jgi:hypothetical protein
MTWPFLRCDADSASMLLVKRASAEAQKLAREWKPKPEH